MIYTVVWKQSAEKELVRLWMEAPDRAAVTQAADTLDALLRSDPEAQGRPHHRDSRILILPPLVFLFDISEPDRRVTVLAVGLVRSDSGDRPRN